MRKVLIIGGSGTISSSVSKELFLMDDVSLYVMNRGNKVSEFTDNAVHLICDANDDAQVEKCIGSLQFDCVINFIIFTPEQALHNVKLFSKRTKQFVFISTLAACNHENTCICNEQMLTGNPFSDYGMQKSLAEKVFFDAFQKEGFPITIVRPSQTYSHDKLPLSVKGKNAWSVVSRMIKGKKVIVHGDGQSVWASTHADDFARALMLLIQKANPPVGEVFQIVNNEPHTWDMLYKELARQLKVDYKPVYIPSSWLSCSKQYNLMMSIYSDKRYSCIYDLSKLKEYEPDFSFTISIQEGIKRFLIYMEKYPELMIEDHKYDVWCDETIAVCKKARSVFQIR